MCLKQNGAGHHHVLLTTDAVPVHVVVSPETDGSGRSQMEREKTHRGTVVNTVQDLSGIWAQVQYAPLFKEYISI